ncbi:MAG: alpha/beta hydrolase, partial [Proteobacteria bacterium]|nr:alpha/beta hydrolase [Pseudomonadota bacterium]
HPDLIKALILQGSPGRNPFERMNIGIPVRTAVKALTTINRRAPKWAKFINKAAALAPAVAREIVRATGFNPTLARSEDIDEYISHFFQADSAVFYELAEDLSEFDITKFDHVIDCPALVLAGAKDRIVPLDECRWLAKRLPGAQLEIIPHGSHCPHLDDPADFNERILKFLTTYQP